MNMIMSIVMMKIMSCQYGVWDGAVYIESAVGKLLCDVTHALIETAREAEGI